MYLDFEKWHGCRNDFVIVWLSDLDDLVTDSLKRQAVAICDRRAGIGADGVLVLQTRKRDELTPYRLTIINSDGSIAGNCGNGLRCAALSVLRRHREMGDPKDLPELVELEVEQQTMTCRFLHGASGPGRRSLDEGGPHVAVEMGVPRVNEDVDWHADAGKALAKLARELNAPALQSEYGVCEIGNPHLVVTTEAATRDLALRAGPLLQTSPLSDGLNVHIVKPAAITDKDETHARAELGQGLSELFTAYVWERGAGETPACGSGACAIAACAIATGLVDRGAWVGVDMPGGRLYVKHDADDEPIVLAGPGTFVYSGRLAL